MATELLCTQEEQYISGGHRNIQDVGSQCAAQRPREKRPRAARGGRGRGRGGFRLLPSQTSLLRSLDQPSQSPQLPAWAARVRQRLCVLEKQIRKLDHEKQTLLCQLSTAAPSVIEGVLHESQPLSPRVSVNSSSHVGEVGAGETCPVIDAAGRAPVVGKPSMSLWQASRGHDVSVLRQLCGDGSQLHPALVKHLDASPISAPAKPANLHLNAHGTPAVAVTEAIIKTPSPARPAHCHSSSASATLSALLRKESTSSTIGRDNLLRREASNDQENVFQRETIQEQVMPPFSRNAERVESVAEGTKIDHCEEEYRIPISNMPIDQSHSLSSPSAEDSKVAVLRASPSRDQSHTLLCTSSKHLGLHGGELPGLCAVSRSDGDDETALAPRSPSIASTVVVSSDESCDDGNRHEKLQHEGACGMSDQEGPIDDEQDTRQDAQNSAATASVWQASSPSRPSAISLPMACHDVPASDATRPCATVDDSTRPNPSSDDPNAHVCAGDDEACALDASRSTADHDFMTTRRTFTNYQSPCVKAATRRKGSLLERLKQRQSERGYKPACQSHASPRSEDSSPHRASGLPTAVQAQTCVPQLSSAVAVPAPPSGDLDALSAVSGGDCRNAAPSSSSTSVEAIAHGVSSASSRKQATPCQFFPNDMDDSTLRKWFSFFGLKPCGSREFMVRKLSEIDAYVTQSLPRTEHADRRITKKRNREPTSGITSGGRRKRNLPPAREQMPAEDAGEGRREGRAAAKAAEMEQAIASAIRADTELYERLLLFEPVDLGELRQRLTAARPELQSLGEQRLRKFMDAQGFLWSGSWNQSASRTTWRRF